MIPKKGDRAPQGAWNRTPASVAPPKPSAPSSSSPGGKKSAAGLDFTNAAGKIAASRAEASDHLRTFILNSITGNNVLALPESEIANVAKLLMSTQNKSEIYEWTKTLMQPDSFSAEIIKQRNMAEARFGSTDERSKSPSSSSSSSAAAAAAGGGAPPPLSSNASEAAPSTASTSRGGKKGGGSKGGVKVDLRHGVQDGGDVMLRGELRECGCFASAHPFRSNCANCGRIFCQQEDDSVCYACKLPPASCLAYDLKVTLGKISDAVSEKNQADLTSAVERRDQLLQFARERAKRTTVVDDQSGVHMGSSTDPWAHRNKKEKDEADAAAEKERMRVAELHRRSGALTVHLDIVNQCVQLGATPLLSRDGQIDQSEKVVAVAMGGGFKDDDDGDDDDDDKAAAVASSTADGAPGYAAVAAAARTEDDVKKAEKLKKLGQQKDADSDDRDNEKNNEADEDDVDDFEQFLDENDRRVIPLPSLLQKIFYCEDEKEAEKKTAIKGVSSSGNKTLVVGGKKQQGGGAATAAAEQQKKQQRSGILEGRKAEERKDAVAGSALAGKSRRVQVEYYEEDLDVFVEAEARTLQKGSSGDTAVEAYKKRADKNNSERQEDNERLLQFSLEAALAEWGTSASTAMKQGNPQQLGSSAVASASASSSSSSPSPAAGTAEQMLLQKARKLWHKDDGTALSMHQPWAQLLVAGIKTHEGRGWPVPDGFRGRLWIHAAAHKPTPEDIQRAEAHAAQYVPPGTKFPTHYPTSCLLGCVALVDCLEDASGEDSEYKKAFRPEQRQLDGSPYCWLCMCPKTLPFNLQMSGEHKIYKLEKKHWMAARKLLNEPPVA